MLSSWTYRFRRRLPRLGLETLLCQPYLPEDDCERQHFAVVTAGRNELLVLELDAAASTEIRFVERADLRHTEFWLRGSESVVR